MAVIKIDVEGHELSVLRGAAETLARCKPLCIVECEERHNAGGVAQAFAFFAGLGYRPYFYHGGTIRDGGEFDVTHFQMAGQAKVVDGGRGADDVNNFIFVHPDNAAGLQKIKAQYA